MALGLVVFVVLHNSALPVAASVSIDSPSVLRVANTDYSASSAHTRLPLTLHSLEKKDFAASEEVVATVSNPNAEQFKTKVVDAGGNEADVTVDQIDYRTTSELQIVPSNQFKPGKYTITVTDRTGKTSTQDFTWGVLALNPDKAVYKPHETASIAMAVLDDKGNMVCDAQVELEVRSESGEVRSTLSTENGEIRINPECTSHAFTLKPDYEAQYSFGDEGVYELTLTAKTKNGTRTITDAITVKNDVPFTIKRTSATRIYPPNVYPMHLEITASEDFTGTVTETVPDSFIITSADDAKSYDDMSTVYMSNNDPAADLEKKVLSGSDSLLEMPFNGSYTITQGFGHELTDTSLRDLYSHFGLAGHDGIDFALPIGTPLFAVDEGVVVWSGPGEYGTQVIVQHKWGKSYYGHMSKTTVEKGFTVTKGGYIGYSGNTGKSTGPHLHFSIKPNKPDMQNGYAGKIDPMAFLPKEGRLPATQTLSLVEQTAVLSATDSAEENSESEARNPKQIQNTNDQIVSRFENSSLENSDIVSNFEIRASDLHTGSMAAFTITDEEIAQQVGEDQPEHIERVKVLSWDVQLKKGETTTLSYNYKAPDISPQFYVSGPLQFFANVNSKSEAPNGSVYEEPRSWQIAADALGVSWYNDGTAFGGYNWQYRKEITIQDSQVPATQTNFPVVISLTSDSDLSSKAQADGDDILFTDSTGRTKLSHEIEKYSSGTLVAWVKVPTLNGSSNTTLYMYYGNPAAAAQESPTNVWDSNFKAVYHAKETSNVTTIADSTSNNYTMTKRAAAGPAMTTSGKNGNALDFERSNQDYAVNTPLASAIGSGSFSISVWFKPEVNMTSGTAEHHLMNLGDLSGASDIVIFFIDNNLIFKLYDSGDTKNELSVASTWNAGTWYHGYFVYDASAGMRMYMNGSLIDSDTFTDRGSYSSGTFDLGRNSATVASDKWWDGLEDDIHISNSVRSANWIQTEYNNQNSPGTFSTLGSEETKIYSTTNDKLMRHGKFFDSAGAEQPFLF